MILTWLSPFNQRTNIVWKLFSSINSSEKLTNVLKAAAWGYCLFHLSSVMPGVMGL